MNIQIKLSFIIYFSSFQHVNDLSQHIELPWTLSKAEGIYLQLISVAPHLPNNIRTIIGLEPLNRTPESCDLDISNGSSVSPSNGESSFQQPESDGNVKFGDNEVSFERGLNLSYT